MRPTFGDLIYLQSGTTGNARSCFEAWRVIVGGDRDLRFVARMVENY
jgi:hypothetical protein